jgi:allene oxide cyclase
MKKVIVVAAGLVLACAALPGLATEKIQLVERADNEVTTDLGAKGDSAGDLLTFANPIFDAANKTKMGSDQGYCVRVIAGKSWECIWTLTLAAGTISVEGSYYDAGDSVMAVTGGTGKYTGAKGALKLHPRDAKSTSYDFLYELL